MPAGDDWHGDVLLFDQFEEVLTVDPTDRDGQARLLRAGRPGAARPQPLGAVLHARGVRGQPGSLPAAHPHALRPRPALPPGSAGPDAARRPCRARPPIRTRQVVFTDDAVSRLVDDLRRTQVQAPDGTMPTTLGQHVEPVQLQVVCRRLWDGLAPDDLTIDLDDVAAVGDVDTALARLLRRHGGKAVAASSGVRERAIREWCNGQLITEGGIRGQVLLAAQASQGLANAAIWPLVDSHLVRADAAARGHLVRAGPRPADRAGARRQRGLVRGPPEPPSAPGRAVGKTETAGSIALA